METSFEDCYILIADKKITTMQDILPALEFVSPKGKPLLIIAEDVDKQVISTLVVNKIRIGLKICCVKQPAFGQRSKDMLEDIAILTGGTVLNDSNFDTISEETLGRCEKATITGFDTTIVNGFGNSELLKDRITLLNTQIASTTDTYEKEKLQERLAKLTKGIAVRYVGAASEVEMKEKKDRVDDALGAVKCAVEEGVVPGGGIALFSINGVTFEGLNADERSGVAIILSCLSVPLQTILFNAGLDINQILMDISCKQNYKAGYDAKNECHVDDMFLAGIIDPTKVTKTALKNAASIASMILTTECIVDKTWNVGLNN
jgi:chaperonin GroEL